MLEVTELHAYYGKSHILRGVNFSIGDGEIVSLLGRNGVGRSTTVKSIIGEIAPQGSIKFQGEEIAGLKSFQIAHKGIAYVPENREIFPSLTVRQNLILGMKSNKASSRWTIDEIFSMFPNLAEREHIAGGVLSGGEQQMLSMCRALMGDPQLIMIDEPTEGLAPKLVKQVGELLQEIAKRGVSILLVEQKLSIALKISHRLYVMGHGKMVYEGTPESLMQADDVRAEWLEV
ncbi:MAG: ABC transporter ATP-binding protein [SAR86 cluster bacterium]|uniref:ABC transporter ATP-binding protein n=1 Tax=SAR86 cluster bacterium TaxID=2030880 RepID=A0A2A4MFH4_9GAMM|nr:MAG: ABC transporter ATP-binding protein [SAR86 cluster bacterium]